MAGFIDHLNAEISVLERDLEGDPRYVKLRELRKLLVLYGRQPAAALTDSPSLKEVDARSPRRMPVVPREMAPTTKRVIETAQEIMRGRTEPFPLRDLYHEIAEVRGVPVGGKEPINNLSAMLYRYGFEAVGRSGWRVRESKDESAAEETVDGDDPEADGVNAFCTSLPAALEIHGAATH